MTNRDAVNPDIVAQAMAEWSRGLRDGAANDRLLVVLTEQGVLAPNEASEAYMDPYTTADGWVIIEIHDGTTLVFVSPEGDITTMRG